VHIRRASKTDVAAIEAVLQQSGSSWAGRHVEAELARDISVVLVASPAAGAEELRDGAGGAAAPLDEVLGVAVAWAVAGDSHLLELAVAADARRRGVGTQLLEEAIAHTLAPGGVALLEVRESNSGARRLYNRLGFEEVGRRARYYSDSEAAILW
jgi:ribosomal-protein-alanine N-acetyltransferase